MLLRMGEGRFCSGRINKSKLADSVITSMKPNVGKARIREIIREAIWEGKLTD